MYTCVHIILHSTVQFRNSYEYSGLHLYDNTLGNRAFISKAFREQASKKFFFFLAFT